MLPSSSFKSATSDSSFAEIVSSTKTESASLDITPSFWAISGRDSNIAILSSLSNESNILIKSSGILLISISSISLCLKNFSAITLLLTPHPQIFLMHSLMPENAADYNVSFFPSPVVFPLIYQSSRLIQLQHHFP